MHIDNLARANELQAELKLWRETERRLDPGVFREATLRVADMAHGHRVEPDRPPQSSETVIKLTPEHLLPFVRQQIARVTDELREIGVEI